MLMPESYNRTDQVCPQYFQGALDEVRIYPSALTYGQVMDDRFHCSQEPAEPHLESVIQNPIVSNMFGSIRVSQNRSRRNGFEDHFLS